MTSSSASTPRRPSCSPRAAATCCPATWSASCSRPSRPGHGGGPGGRHGHGRHLDGLAGAGDAQPPAPGRRADRDEQVVIGPGSLFTSVLAAVAVRVASPRRWPPPTPRWCTSATCVPRSPRPRATTWRPSARPWPGTMLRWTWCDSAGMSIGTTAVPVHDVPLTGENTLVHSPAKLARAVRSAGAPRSTERKGRDDGTGRHQSLRHIGETFLRRSWPAAPTSRSSV